MKPPAFEYTRPGTLPAALETLSQLAGGLRPMAGGQSLIPMLNLRLSRPETVMDLALLDALRGVERHANSVDVGALTTHAQLEDGLLDDVANGYLTHVAGGIAYRAIRNHGTVAGSLAHADPAADWPTALSALGASVVVVGASGEREIPLERFFVAPFTTALEENELIRCVRIPARSSRTRWAYIKLARKTGEFAESIVAAILDPEHGYARIAVGGLGGTPLLLLTQNDDPMLGWLNERPSLPVLAQKLEALAGPGVNDPIQLRIHAAALMRALEALS